MRRLVFQFAIFAASATAHAPSVAAPAPTAEERLQLAQVIERGLNLYRYDQSAWHVTDAALPVLSDDAKRVARGYVTTPTSLGLKTTFFGEVDGNLIALYSAIWTGTSIAEPQVFAPDRRVPVSAEENRLIKTRHAALASSPSIELCSSSSPNIVVVPASTGDLVYVYILTSQTKSGSYSFGGHHRLDVRGEKVVAARKFANSCLSMSTADAPPNAKELGFYMTHLLDPIPTEIHVFNALQSKTRVIVGTERGTKVYSVEPGNGRPTITRAK